MLKVLRAQKHTASILRPFLSSTSSRSVSTETKAYPFSKDAVILPGHSLPPDPRLLKGINLTRYLRETLPTPPALKFISTLFNPHHPDRLLPGSVVALSLANAPASFSGVLISIRHAGPETSFTLRNVVQRTGVEMRFKVASPMIKDIKVIQRAGGKSGNDGKRARRAKLFYLRDQPAKMNAISAGVRKALA
jgi:large subunit ribosomal protein L19